MLWGMNEASWSYHAPVSCCRSLRGPKGGPIFGAGWARSERRANGKTNDAGVCGSPVQHNAALDFEGISKPEGGSGAEKRERAVTSRSIARAVLSLGK